MEINLKNALKISTNYNFKKYRDDVLIQEENTHNIIGFQLLKLGGTVASGTEAGYYYHLGMNALALGSGTTEPTEADTALTSPLWGTAKFGAYSREVTYDEKSITVVQSFSIAATTTYVGTIAECGLYGGSRLKTHALIRDAEGNPITIEKTDLDKLLVTVSITFTFTLPEGVYLVPLNKSPLYYGLSNGACAPIPLPAYNNVKNYAFLSQDYQEVLQNGVSADTYYDFANKQGIDFLPGSNSGWISADSNNQATISLGTRRFVGRVRASTGNYNAYIKAIIFLGLFIIPLPNEEIFPFYEMTDISIGVGDGATTQFLNPMNYFKKDTDKVYKNGVLLTRDVDYTIDYRHNNDNMPELFACADAIITGGTRIYQYPCAPIFRPCAFGSLYNSSVYGGFRGSHRIDSFSTDAPLFFDFKKEETINYLKIGANHNNYIYTLYYSTDGEEYIEAGSFTKTSSLNELTLETPIVAQYWKLTISPTSGTNSVSSGHTPYVSVRTTVPADSSLSNPNLFCNLGYRGDPYITFTEAPAVDDVITMDVTLDLPFKNANNVIDYDLTISLY